MQTGLSSIYVLMQYNSTSLSRHVTRAYAFVSGDPFSPARGAGFVECLNATQRPGHVKGGFLFGGEG